MNQPLRKFGCRPWVVLCALIAIVVVIISAAWCFTRGPCRGLLKSTSTSDLGDVTSALPPSPPPPGVMIVADFDQCSGGSNLDTGMGAACPNSGCLPPNSLVETYEPGPDRDQCAVRLDYNISSWSAFWIKLPKLDLQPDYDRLTFEVRAEPGFETPKGVRVELKRDCVTKNGVTDCGKMWYKEQAFPGQADLNSEWRTVTVDFATLVKPDNSPLVGIEEVVFTFTGGFAGFEGVIYLDNVWFRQP